MGHNEFGKETKTLEEAVHLLELARAADTKNEYDWVIVVNVATKVKKQ